MKANKKAPAYDSFQDIHGNEYHFETYIEFSCWWFNQHARHLKMYFSPETYKKLQYAAANSRDARKPMTQEELRAASIKANNS